MTDTVDALSSTNLVHLTNCNNDSKSMSAPSQLFAIRGYMKSGTNWVCNLLNLHPRISCVGEFHWERVTDPFVRNVDIMIDSGRVRDFRESATACLKAMIANTVREANDPSATWCGDRTPGSIEPDVFPDARYFHIIRDGRDVLVSRAYHLLRRPETTQLFDEDPALASTLALFQQDPGYFVEKPLELLRSEKMVRQTAQSWNRIVRHNLSIAELRPEIALMAIRYENLHDDLDHLRDAMYRFLDVDPQEAEPLTAQTRPGFRTEQPSKFYRKGAVGDWVQYFAPQVREWFEDETDGLLEELGYRW